MTRPGWHGEKKIKVIGRQIGGFICFQSVERPLHLPKTYRQSPLSTKPAQKNGGSRLSVGSDVTDPFELSRPSQPCSRSIQSCASRRASSLPKPFVQRLS